MVNEETTVSRRRLLGGVVTLGLAGAAAGAGTMAYFTDTESSTGNTLEAGTLLLSFGNTGSFSFSTALAPTQSTSDSVTLVKDGSVNGSVDVDVDYTESDASDAPDPDMDEQEVAENLEVITLTYDGADLTGQIVASEDPPTLHDLATNAHDGTEDTPNDLINLADPEDGKDFTIELRLKDVSDDYQGDGVDVEFTFHLNQTDGQ